MNELTETNNKGKLLSRFAGRYGVDQDKLLSTLKNTAFKQKNGEVTNEQMMALMVVADQYKLNPFTKEIYAFPDKDSIVPVVGVDGWSRIINEHPQFDGMDFRQSDEMVTMDGAKPCPEWIECVMYRKDREHPIVVREYLDECYRRPFREGMQGPWQTHTKRFLRHKTMIQCSRLAFGFAGIYDADEAERIQEAQSPKVVNAVPARPDREPYSDERMKQNIAGFKAAIENGRRPEDLIAMIESKYTLTEQQREQIRNLTAIDAEEITNEDA
jgi:phage recombination protein Bet